MLCPYRSFYLYRLVISNICFHVLACPCLAFGLEFVLPCRRAAANVVTEISLPTYSSMLGEFASTANHDTSNGGVSPACSGILSTSCVSCSKEGGGIAICGKCFVDTFI